MRRTLRIVSVIVLAVVALWLVPLNWHLYRPGRVDTAIAQLGFLEKSLADGGAERMQAIFPEGYVFTWALDGLAAAQAVRALAATDRRRDHLLAMAREAVRRVDSERARATFVADMQPRFGVFYSSWSLYLRSCVLRVSGSTGAAPFDLEEFQRDCDSLATALSRSSSPFLESYPGQVWPADTAPGVAALTIADSYFGGRYRTVIERWLEAVRQRCDNEFGAIPHAADAMEGRPLGVPRGESLALMSCILVEVDSSLARKQYEILRRNFVDCVWGLVGVREYPHGVDGRGDIDSGPIVLGFGGPSTVVGIGAALANGDLQVANALMATPEIVGLPLEIAGQRRYAGGRLPVGDAFLAWARSTRPAHAGRPYSSLLPWWWRLPTHAVSLGLVALVAFVAVRTDRRGSERGRR